MNMLKLVTCDKKYWEFVRNLRLDNRVTDGFIKTEYITKEMQEKYMGTHSDFYRISLFNDEPVGYVGVIEDDIRVCTHPDYQGKGVGKFMINECMKIWPSAFAKVKIDNEASLKLFKSCGFHKKFIIMKKNE